MDLDLLNHRDYQVGGGLVVAIFILLFVLGLSLTTLVLIGAVTVGAGYWLRCHSTLPGSHGLLSWLSTPTYDSTTTDRRQTSSHGVYNAHSPASEKVTASGKSSKRAWKVIIGDDHTPSSSADMSGRRSLLLTPAGGGRAGGRSAVTGGRDPLTPASLLGSPLSPATRRTSARLTPGSSGLPLPRVRRVRGSSHSEGGSALYSPSRGGRSPQVPSPGVSRRYPTHQPQYAGLGLMPPVHLNRPDRHVLSDRNTTMLTSPVTVKIAPPDVLRPPIPSIVPVEEPTEPDTSTLQNPCDTQNILTAIREKRKRTMRDDEEVTPTVETRVSKRRRQVVVTESPAETPAAPPSVAPTQTEEPDTTRSLITGSLKRPAISRSRAASISDMEEPTSVTKRSRSAGPAVPSPSSPGIVGHARNPIEVSYSSSKRWLEKKNQSEMEEPSSKKRLTRSQSRETSAKKRTDRDGSDDRGLEVETGPMRRLSPRRILSLVDQDTPMKDESGARENKKQESAPSTSDKTLGGPSACPKTPDLSDPATKRKLFPMARDSSSRRRHTQIRSDSNAEFSKVPTLRYTLTSEDYEKDRASEMKRVEQMLDDVEEAHAAKTAAKTAKVAPVTTTAPTVSLGAVSATAVKTDAPTLTSSVKPGLGIATTASLKLASTKPISLTSPLTALGGASSAESKVPSSSSKLGVSPPPASVTTVTSLATPLLQTGPASGGTPAAVKPVTTMVNTVLFKHSPSTTTAASSAVTGVVGPLAGSVSSVPAASAPSVTSSTRAAGTKPTPSTQYSFTPVFGTPTPGSATATPAGSAPAAATSLAPAAAAATTTASGLPQPAFGAPSLSGTKPTATTGFSFGTVNSSTPASSSALPAAPATGNFTFGGAAPKPAATTSVTSGQAGSTTGFAFGGAPTNTAASTRGFAFGAAKTTAAASATTAAPSFSFGGAQTATATPKPNTFGAALSGGATSTAPFGATAQTAVSSAPSFSTGSSLSSSSAFGVSTSTPFGSSAATGSNTTAGFAFGTGAQTQTSSKPIVFGQTGAATSTTGASQAGSAFGQGSTITFGQASSTTPSTSVSIFGGTQTKTATATGAFGTQPSSGQTMNSGFQFGTTTNQAATTNSAFQFGAANTGQQQSAAPFAFGAQAATTTKPSSGVITFGQPSSTTTSSGLPKPNLPAPAFGTATTNNAFGSSSSNAFGSSSGSAFGGGGNNPPPPFGQATGTQNAFGTNSTSSNAFGSNTGAQSGAFGSSGGAQPGAFGSSNTGVFGGQQQGVSGFGAPTSTQPNKGFDFSASAKPTINFGGAAPAPQQAPQPAGFNFGAANTQSQPGAFNFNSGGGQAFGLTAPGTPQMRGPAPAFGTPNTTPTAMPNPFSTGTPGGFTVGSGNTQPRPRTTVRAARRRTTKR